MITKFGEIKAGEFILINGLFFKATQEFDLYFQTLGFKWANIEGNWNDFPYYLVGRKLGYLYREEGDHVVVYTVDENRRLMSIGEPIPAAKCEEIVTFNDDPNRTFMVDTHAPIRLAMGQLESLVPDINDFDLSAQKLYYLGAGLHDYHLSNEVRTILEDLLAEGDPEKILRELNALVDMIEAKLSRRKANSSIEKHGYAVTGIAGKEGEPSFLYTTGLAVEHGFELFCRSKVDVLAIGELIKYYAAGVHAGQTLEVLHTELKAKTDWKYPKGKPVLSRREPVKNFTYRVQDNFDIYQLLLD